MYEHGTLIPIEDMGVIIKGWGFSREEISDKCVEQDSGLYNVLEDHPPKEVWIRFERWGAMEDHSFYAIPHKNHVPFAGRYTVVNYLE